MTRKIWSQVLSGVFMGLAFLNACAIAQKSETHSVKSLLLYPLRVRQLLAQDSGRSESFFESPYPVLDPQCLPLSTWFQSVSLSALRQCLEETQQNEEFPKLTYVLKTLKPPMGRGESVFELDTSQPISECMRKELPFFSLPQEMIFQARDGVGRLQCYSARLSGVQEGFLFSSRTQLSVSFPLSPFPEGDPQMLQLLGSWIASAFFNLEGRIESSLLPERECQRCLGEKNLFSPLDPLPPFWP
ncbi:MAG: hypothetical protein ACO3A2_05895 [Bdellovibrionia bacterium]